MSRRVIAAGLLSLTLIAACSDGPDRRSGTLAPPSAEKVTSGPDATSTSAAPSTDGGTKETPPTRAAPPARPSPAALAPAPASAAASAAAPQEARPEVQRTKQGAQPASEPSPTRTATKTPTPSTSAASAPAQAGQFALTIRDFAFSPQVMTVPVGSTVTATNKDEAIHDWTSGRGVWGSGDLREEERFSFTFTEVGTYDFLCERHSSMTGTVNVTPR